MLSTKKIKKRLFFILLLECLLPWVFLCAAAYIFYPDFLKNHQLVRSFVDSGMGGFLGIIFGLPILYFAAYKKPGTRWLTFSIWTYTICLIWTTFVAIMSLILSSYLHYDHTTYALTSQIASKYGQWQSVNQFIYFILFKSITEFLHTILLVYMILYFIKLRKKNLLTLYKNTLKSKTYKELYARIDKASNRQELEKLVCNLKTMYPELKKFIIFKSKQKKRDFAN